MPNYIGYIYSITNAINGKTYIGKTNNLSRRWKEHAYGKGNTAILSKAIKKYGLNHFIFDVVAQIPFDSTEQLNNVLKELEIYYISLYDSFKNGYNATIGGDGISYYRHNENTKKLLRKIQKERWLDPDFRNKCGKAALGYHHTQKAKDAIRDAVLSRDHSIYERIASKRKGNKRDSAIIEKGAKKRRKPILQYDLKGKFIREYDSALSVNKEWATNICSCCRGKINSAFGYIWKYKLNENFPTEIDVPSYHICNRAITQYTKSGKYMRDYKSATIASKETGIGRKAITNCLGGLSNSAGGFIWKYNDER